MKDSGLALASGMLILNLTAFIVLLMGLNKMMATGVFNPSLRERITAINIAFSVSQLS